MQITYGTHIKALNPSRHAGYCGTVVVTGQYLVVRCDEDKPNPLAWKSNCYGEGTFFCLDANSAAPIKG